jgi:ADP-ribose pyrophosphatase
MSDSTPNVPENAKLVFKGIVFDVYQWEQELFDGTTTMYERLHRRPAAFIIPVVGDDRILIAEDEQPQRPLKITFPGGQIEDNETPEEGVVRELREETGYVPEAITLFRKVALDSKIDWHLYGFIGRGCQKAQEPNPDAGERITTREVSLDELIALADDPRFQNTMMVPDLLKARYDRESRALLERALFG